MGRPTIFETGPLTATERKQRWRARVRANSLPWWQQMIDADYTPTTPNESLKLYYALSEAVHELERKQAPYIDKAGETLLQAQKFFPTKAAWERWLRAEVKTCRETTRRANYAIAWAEAGRRMMSG